LEEFFYELQWIACFQGGCFAVSFVFDLGFFVFSLDGYFWVKTDE